MLSRVLFGVPVGVRFENERNNRPPPSSSLLLVGGFLNTLQLSFSCCAKAGELKMAINNKNPATFFIDNFLPGLALYWGNVPRRFRCGRPAMVCIWRPLE